MTLRFSSFLTLLVVLSSYLSAADDHADHHHAELVKLGELTVGEQSVSIAIAGNPVSGYEWEIAVILPPNAPAPKAVRAWVGVATGRGSEKAKAENDSDHPSMYEAHINLPDPLPAESQLWISLENAAGVSSKAALPLPPIDVHDHAGHSH